MANDPISLYVGDERPDWVETIIVNGAKEDYTGATFVLAITDSTKTVLATYSNFTTGDTEGRVTTVWAGQSLIADGITATEANPVQRYTAYLTITPPSADDITIERPLIMKWRPT